MLLRHLALAVTDERRSQEFYERWFGFDASRPMDDGVTMLHRPGHVSLALGPAEGPPSLPAFLHFGFVLDSPEAVRESRDAFAAAGVEIADFWTSPTTSASRSATPTATSSSWRGSRARSGPDPAARGLRRS